MIKQEARRVWTHDRAIERSDLEQIGRIAVEDAKTEYDSTRGDIFGFIRKCVRNAMLKAARGELPPVTVEHMKRIRLVERELAQALKAPPTVEQIARAAYLTVAQVTKALRVEALFWPSDVEDIVDDAHEPGVSSAMPDVRAEALSEALAEAMCSLTPRHQRIVSMIHLEERSHEEAVRELGLTEANASRQLLSRAMDKLRVAFRAALARRGLTADAANIPYKVKRKA
jgi:RNA polymerase sigma factor (sigma-70 family)